jgi:diaminohydroxyphosphoribosylaminopyrimidine deaminase/5-amino-6-(5-phosphoribosylamino)uracil reductase
MLASTHDRRYMARAIQLAARGQGRVEPNPMVGCVIVRSPADPDLALHEHQVVGEGWHRQYGGPHAEVEALGAAGPRAEGGTMYVSLEPCCHHGKTPPCSQAVIAAGIRRVVIAQADPFAQVAGQGIGELRRAGIEVLTGVLEQEARRLNAPYLKLIGQQRPWMIAKWAMTLDGKLATHSGHSQWISGRSSRAVVHQLRGRMDAILIGSRTARADDPRLTARPPGPRVATRVVADSRASLDPAGQLARTARQVPVLVAVSEHAPAEACRGLTEAGCELLVCPGETDNQRLEALLDQLGQRRMTNVLVEGGSHLLGVLWDLRQIDEVHVFVAPKLVGGARALSPLGGQGLAHVPDDLTLDDLTVQQLDHDVYVSGRLVR